MTPFITKRLTLTRFPDGKPDFKKTRCLKAVRLIRWLTRWININKIGHTKQTVTILNAFTVTGLFI
jgi:hypothetical protein